VIIKSIICVDSHIQNGLKKLQNKNSCFEILGFDVLMDSDLRPWLMEVNLSPSLATESPLDLKIKSGLFIDMMNLICIKKFDRRKENLNKMKSRVKNAIRARSYQSRQNLPSASSKQHILQGDEKRQKVFANLVEG
jgi:tubulin polyglutamylase TTLL5